MILGESEVPQELKIGFAKHPLLVLVGAAEVMKFGVAKTQTAYVIEFFAKPPKINDLGELRILRAAGKTIPHANAGALQENDLPHRELVEIGVEK